ncbi:MAG TPA: AAA family ATPase [Ornithinicoccus sp.]|nr:AAA family ATPase [Ornithinicoccus sp.]
MVLLGRTAEQEAVARLLAAARLGRGGVLVVTGEPGIGKTALLADAVSGLTDMNVRAMTGTLAEQDLPFAALHGILRPALPLLDEIPERQAEALGAALLLRPGGSSDRFAIGAATLSLLSRYAEERPLVVIVDDAQWLDVPSLEALAFAARRLHEDPVAVLIATRSHESPELLRDLPELELDGLDAAASAALVAAPLSGQGPEAMQRLFLATGGNPLALLELSADPLDPVEVSDGVPPLTLPDRLRAAFARRLDALAPADRAVVVVAVVAGGDLRVVQTVCAALSLDPEALGRAEQAGLLTTSGGHASFRHPVLRAVIYATASADLRRRVHRAVADQLTGDDVDRRTWHLAAASAGPDERVAALLDDLADRAAGRVAHTIASTAQERAAHLTADPDLARTRLLSAARSAWAAGRPQRALGLLDAAEPVAGPLSPSGLGLRAMIEVRSGSVRRGRDMLEQAAALSAPDERVLLLAEACRASMYLLDMAGLRRVETELSAGLDEVDSAARAIALAASGAAGVMLGEDSIDRIREAAPMLADHVDAVTRPAALPWLMLVPLFLRDADSGSALLRLVDDVRSRVGVGEMPNLLMHLARDQATSTAWRRAAANYDEGIRLARETGQGAELAMLLAGAACLESRQGLAAACREHSTEALDLCRARSIHFGELWCRLALGDLALSEGDTAGAVDQLLELQQRVKELQVADADLDPAPELVEALMRTGDQERAAEVAEAFAAVAAEKGQPWCVARAHRALGLVASPEGFDEPFAAALEHHALTRDTFDTARTQLAYGGRLRRSGRRVEARPLLRTALATFDSLGARGWAVHAESELQATGEKVPSREAEGPGALTPQELQVCLLLADGRTTREAAAALFLSPKTVEYHLRKAYTKLDIHSRTELAAVLAELAG